MKIQFPVSCSKQGSFKTIVESGGEMIPPSIWDLLGCFFFPGDFKSWGWIEREKTRCLQHIGEQVFNTVKPFLSETQATAGRFH